jgi:hypothetical protein
VKFANVMPKGLEQAIAAPERVQQLNGHRKESVLMNADYEAMKRWLMQ